MSTPCEAIDEVVVEVGMGSSAEELAVRWRIVGDVAALRIPERGARLDAFRLWEHTCVELFVAPGAGEGYEEWNVSPCGQVARFVFSAHRMRVSAEAISGIDAHVVVSARELCVEARLPLPADCEGDARLAPTAVLEHASGELSYWAVHHPCERPDFHHRDGFVVALPVTS